MYCIGFFIYVKFNVRHLVKLILWVEYSMYGLLTLQMIKYVDTLLKL